MPIYADGTGQRYAMKLQAISLRKEHIKTHIGINDFVQATLQLIGHKWWCGRCCFDGRGRLRPSARRGVFPGRRSAIGKSDVCHEKRKYSGIALRDHS